MPDNELLLWLQTKITEAQRCVTAREQAAETWKSGSDEDWKSVGASESREQRLQTAAVNQRIAESYRRDVKCLERLIEIVAHGQDEGGRGISGIL